MRKTWLITDTHFGHKMLLNHGRPEHFSDLIFENLQKLVQPGDTLIHLGDICIGDDEKWNNCFTHLLLSPSIKKILVKGNHDNKSDNWYLDHGWDFVCEMFWGRYFGQQIIFSHIPVKKDADFAPHFQPTMNIHGHFHGNNHRMEDFTKDSSIYDRHYYYDIAPDIWDYKPVQIGEVIRYHEKKKVRICAYPPDQAQQK